MSKRDDTSPIETARALVASGLARPASTPAEKRAEKRQVRCNLCRRPVSPSLAMGGSVGTYCPDCYDLADDI